MNRDDTLWYGQYGGCFIADAFSISCDDYYQAYQTVTDSADFAEEYAALCRLFADVKFAFEKAGGDLVLCRTSEIPYPILGTALLTKKLGRKKALCGVRYADEAELCARVCAYLGVNLKLFLAKGLSGIPSLLSYLRALGAECETQSCKELFDLPEMYAFQEWVGSPESACIINCRSNAGAFPQTNIATDFSKEFGEKLKAEMEKNRYADVNCIVAPAISGSYALSVFKAFAGSGKLVSVECDEKDELKEELDSYCGTFTKVMRNCFDDRILAPELANLFDSGAVERKRMSYEEASAAEKELLRFGTPASLQSAAAYAYASKYNEGRTLCLMRAPRCGTVL